MPDNGEQKVPDDPRSRPEEAVDALEERVLGDQDDQERTEDEEQPAAIEQDLDEDEMSSGEGSVPAD